MSLSESVLKKLSNYKVIALALEYRKKFDFTLAKIIKKIFDLREYAFRTLRLQTSQYKIKWANCFLGATVSKYQYSRWKCLEPSGLPESIENLELEDTALKLLKKLDVKIDFSSIEYCHWLLSKEPKRFIDKDQKIGKTISKWGLV